MKKKLMGIALALVVFLGLSATVLASDITFYTDKENGTEIVTIQYVGNPGYNISNYIQENPEKLGYEFIGWATDDSFIAINNDTNVVSVPSWNDQRRNGSAYATWRVVEYGIEYHLDGGVVSGNPESYTVEDEVEITAPTRDGYEFIGWLNEDGDNLGKSLTLPVGTTGDKEFTAAWKKNPEATATTTATETKNPKTGISATADIAILIIGLISFISLVIYNPKKSNN